MELSEEQLLREVRTSLLLSAVPAFDCRFQHEVHESGKRWRWTLNGLAAFIVQAKIVDTLLPEFYGNDMAELIDTHQLIEFPKLESNRNKMWST